MPILHENYNPATRYGALIIANDLSSSAVTGAAMVTNQIGYFAVGTTLSGTDQAEFNVFGTSGIPIAASITAFAASNIENTLAATNVYLSAGQNSVGTVVLADPLSTMATRGPDAALANATLTAGTKLFLERDIDTIVQVVLTFEVD